MGILGDLLMERVRANNQRRNAIQEAQANGLIANMSKYGRQMPDGTVDYSKLALDDAARQSAQDQIDKLVGHKGSDPVAKDQGRILDVFHKVVNTLHGHANTLGGQPAAGASTPPPPPPSGIPPMPSSTQLESGAAPLPQVANTQIPPMPPPTSFAEIMGQGGAGESLPAKAAEEVRQIAPKAAATTSATITTRKSEADAAGLEEGTPQRQYYMATGNMMPVSSLGLNKTMYDTDTGEEFIVRGIGPHGGPTDAKDIEHMNYRAGYSGDVSEIPKLQSPPGGGAPTGVSIGPKGWVDGDPDMPPKAKAALKAGQDSYKSHQQDLTERVLSSARARAEYQAKYRVTPIIDKDGNATVASAWDIISHPENYPANFNEGDKLMLRRGQFTEMHQAIDQLTNAVENMPEEGFTGTQRAQMILAMRSTDPKSAIESWIKSQAAGTLSQAQQDYAQSVASAQESMMVLRGVGGMGNATDKVRDAIGGMTPDFPISKEYAKGQISKINKQMNTLESAQPGIKKIAPRIPALPAAGGGATSGGTVKMMYKGKAWDVPNDPKKIQAAKDRGATMVQ
jgi:hypothetical protein